MSFLKRQSGNTKLTVLLLVVLAVVLAASFAVTMLKDDGSDMLWSEPSEDGSVVFDTPVGKLYYPYERAEYAKIAETTEDTAYIADLYGVVGKKEFKLFSIYINKKALESFLIGNVTDAEGHTYSASILIEELEAADSWSDTTEEEKDLLYAMQEDMNYIVEQIESLPGFTSAY